MRILMRNTVFKTAALAGLFSCMLVLVGAFSGITASVHAITAAEVETEAELKQFVEDAVDAYYLEFLLKQHCDLSTLDLPESLSGQVLTGFLGRYGIQDLSPSSMQMLSTEDVKELIDLFNSGFVQGLFEAEGLELDIWAVCQVPQPNSTFRDVFGGPEEANWKSGSIYLFVAQYPQGEQKVVFHGQDPDLLTQDLTGLEDADNRPVMELIEQAAAAAVQGRPETEKGFLDYCWDDPTVEGDGDEDDGDPLTAPGDSWKTSYVVDPFDSLGLPAPSDSPRVIFGSGIYPKTGEPPSECRIVTGMDDMDDMDDDITEVIEGIVDGGGCAIAAGSDNAPRGTAFNLLLIVSALFFTISFRSRAMDKRNGVRS